MMAAARRVEARLTAISAATLGQARLLLESGAVGPAKGAGPKGLGGRSAASFGIPLCHCGCLAAYRLLEIVTTRRGTGARPHNLCRLHVRGATYAIVPPPALPDEALAQLEALCRRAQR